MEIILSNQFSQTIADTVSKLLLPSCSIKLNLTQIQQKPHTHCFLLSCTLHGEAGPAMLGSEFEETQSLSWTTAHDLPGRSASVPQMTGQRRVSSEGAKNIYFCITSVLYNYDQVKLSNSEEWSNSPVEWSSFLVE